MFMGQWRDREGTLHSAGMADLLLTPRMMCESRYSVLGLTVQIAAAVWVECKAGSGALRPEQRAFRDDVEQGGAVYIECRDSADPVVEWFNRNGVRRA